MNQQQYDEVVKILESDCKTTYVLKRRSGNTCAVGALLEATTEPAFVGQVRPTEAQFVALQERFGLVRIVVLSMMGINDSVRRSRAQRQKKVIECVPLPEVE